MKNIFILASALSLLLVEQAAAQSIMPNPTAAEAAAPRAARARGPATALAVEAAQTAIATCLGNGFKVTALVTDVDGVPVAMISGDGAAAITQRIASGKAMIALKTRMASGAAAAKAKTDTAFAATFADLGAARPGAILISAGSDMIGALAVSGSPTGAADEVCATAGAAKVQDRLK